MSDDQPSVRLYTGPDRRSGVTICRDELVEIARMAAEIAVKEVIPIASKEASRIAKEETIEGIKEDFYQAVGKGVVSKFLWIVGALVVAMYVWAKQQGYIK